MSEDRLTRQELGWLLMQEARGTAQALREGVSQLKLTSESPVTETPEVETMLDALDGAIEMLGVLEAGPLSGKDRRGRIDVAALLVNLAPGALISLEPGAGTEVFGVESVLRRMLGVLIGQPGAMGSSTPSGISIRREGDWIRISVELGPEGTPRRDLEFRWLSRMALRQGGRVELERGKHSLLLPADHASEKREIEQLRKELEQAQQLGAVYARELAEAFSSGQASSSSAPPESVRLTANRLEGLIELATPLSRTLRQIVEGLRADCKLLSSVVAETHPAILGIGRRLSATQDLLVDLDRIAKCDLRTSAEIVDLHAKVRDVVGQLVSRAERLGVRLDFVAEPCSVECESASVVELLTYSLIAQAVLATPSTQSVRISLRISAATVALCIEDGGPIVPQSAFTALLRGVGDPQSLGRPAGVAWLVAGACAEKLGVRIELNTSAAMRSEIRVVLPGVQ